MAKTSGSNNKSHNRVLKRTNQGGSKVKTSTMNKTMKNSFKSYRGQGR